MTASSAHSKPVREPAPPPSTRTFIGAAVNICPTTPMFLCPADVPESLFSESALLKFQPPGFTSETLLAETHSQKYLDLHGTKLVK